MNRVARLGTLTLPLLLVTSCAPTRENQATCKGAATFLGVVVGGTAAGVSVGAGTGGGGAGAGGGGGGGVHGGLGRLLLGNHFCPGARGAPAPAPAPV